MKKQTIVKIYALNLTLFLTLHILTLTNVLDPVVLWDNTLHDTKTMIFAEILLIFLFSIVTIKFYRTSRLLTSQNRLSIIRMLRLLSIFFLLELLGAFLGVETSYKFFGTFFYLVQLCFTFYCLYTLTIKRYPTKQKS